MGFKRTITVSKENGEVLETKGVEVNLNALTIMYVKPQLGSEDLFTFQPTLRVFRMVDVSEGCGKDEECVLFYETCDLVVLPQGRYFITSCFPPVSYLKEATDFSFKVDAIFEEVTKDFKTALELGHV